MHNTGTRVRRARASHPQFSLAYRIIGVFLALQRGPMLRSDYLDTTRVEVIGAAGLPIIVRCSVRCSQNASSKSDKHLATFPSGCGAQVR